MNIIRQNFITVSPNVALSKDSTLSFDLEKKNVFADYLSSAVKGSKFYYGYKHVSDEGEKEFKAAKSYLLYEYNHDYLPKRLKLYDFRDKKWKICAEYSYPYKNRRDYEKDLDESIEVILHGQ